MTSFRRRRLSHALPNIISLARVAIVGYVAFRPEVLGYLPPWQMFVLFLLIYWVSDILDGAVARHLGIASRLGENVDLFSDRCCDLMLSIAVLALADGIEFWATAAFLILRFSPDFLVGRSLVEGDRAYTELLGAGSIFNTSKTIRRLGLEAVHVIRAVFFANCLIPGLDIPGAWVPFMAVSVGFWCFAWMSIFRADSQRVVPTSSSE